MRILVVGSGAREHALAWRLARDRAVAAVLAAPGNPGLAEIGTTYGVKADDVAGLVALARAERVDLVVVGPEAPLALGLVDACAAAGLLAFGPTQAAARIEASKTFAKDLLARYGIPTARFALCHVPAEALAAVRRFGAPVVVKADGLAAGKGAIVATTLAEAEQAVDDLMVRRVFGAAGAQVVVEEYLEGEEIGLTVISDGECHVALPVTQDHKRIGEGDTGPNTGGMGAYAPVSFVSPAEAAELIATISVPTLRALAREGLVYRGVLYSNVMLTRDGPYVLEHNCRFGDPESQALMPLVEGALAEALAAAAQGDLRPADLGVASGAAFCVVMAAPGYPGPPQTGQPIGGIDAARAIPGCLVFHAGTARRDGQLVSAGGRVLSVVGVGPTLAAARDLAYRGVAAIDFPGAQFRRDLGRASLAGPPRHRIRH